MDDQATRYLDDIAAGITLDEGAAGVKRVLVELHRHGSLGGRELAKHTRFSPATISVLLDKLASDGIVHRDKQDGAKFTLKGMQFAQGVLGIRSLAGHACTSCEGTGFDIDARGIDQRIHDMAVAVASARPPADVTLDQAKCLPETTVRRLLLMHARHAFDGTRVAFLGDDDFMSVAASSAAFLEDFYVPALSGNAPPFSATVLDVDTRILEGIATLSGSKDFLPVDTRRQDLRDPVPADLRGTFDVVFTDPPYTEAGATLFLSRAASVLRPRPGATVFFSFGHVSPRVTRHVQEIILSTGFVIEQAIPSFNRYEGGNIIGNTSQMFVLASTGTLDPPVQPDEPSTRPIYTAGAP